MKLELILKAFYDEHPTKKIIFLYVAGSHFFDLNGTNSDRDYRGVYIDESQDGDLYRKKICQVEFKTNQTGKKNSANDVDFNLVSLSSFFDLLKTDDFNMIEALYVPIEHT